MYEDILLFDDLTKLPLMNTLLQDIINCEPKNEDIRKVKIPDRGRGFVFYPSHLKSYVLLKASDPDLAILFLEELISYGITENHITRNPIIRGMMENITPVIDKQYVKYLEYCARDKHKFDYYDHPEDRLQATSIEELI